MIQCDSKTITELRQEMTRIRRLGKLPVTNYFNQCSRSTGPLKCWIGKAAMAFLWNDNGVPRIFFYSADDEELTQILTMAEPGSCIDYITKDRSALATIFAKAGFVLFSEFGRIFVESPADSHTQPIKQEENIERLPLGQDGVGCAQIEDAEELDACLREKFSAYDSHFYDLETLRDHIRKGWAYIVRKDGRIIASRIVEIQGRKQYGAFLFNNGTVEDLSALLSTMEVAMAKKGCTYNYGWIDLKNKRALRLNIKVYGFQFDGTYDVIYVKPGNGINLP